MIRDVIQRQVKHADNIHYAINYKELSTLLE